jgi:hypothetical protein
MSYLLSGTTGQDLTSNLTNAFEFGVNNFAICFNVIFYNLSSIQGILCAGEGVNSGSSNANCQWVIFAANASNELGFIRKTSPSIEFYNKFNWAYQTNTLYNVCLLRSSGTMKLFVNAVETGSSIVNTTNISAITDPSFRIGSIFTGGASVGYKYANIEISEIAIWKNSLTNNEINALHKGFTADQICPQSLAFYAPLIRNLVDLRGGLVITNNNGATPSTHPRIYT